jgi:hypothetical protein
MSSSSKIIVKTPSSGKFKYFLIIVLFVGGCFAWRYFRSTDELPMLEATELPILTNVSHDQPHAVSRPSAQPYAEILNDVANSIFTTSLNVKIPSPYDKLNRIASTSKIEYNNKIISEPARNLVCGICSRLNNAYTERESCIQAYKAAKNQKYTSLKGGLNTSQMQARHVQSVLDKWQNYVAKYQVAIRSDLATMQNLIRE